MIKERGIFTGMDEESYQKLKDSFNLPDKREPKPKPKTKKKKHGKNKRRNSRADKSHSGK